MAEEPAEAVTGKGALRRRFLVDGIVQGVGFRPFVTNLAADLELTGFVTNTSDGVVIEVQGSPDALESFAVRLESDAPPLAMILAVAGTECDPEDGTGAFTIVASEDTPGTRTLIPPDVATCADCLREMRDPQDRRFGYPFINCTNCGPRWTIIERIPYDRTFTSMAPFITRLPVTSRIVTSPILSQWSRTWRGHSQRIGARERMKFAECWSVWIVALGTLEFLWGSLQTIPKTERFPMGATLPVPEGGAMAFGTQILHLIISDRRAIMENQLVTCLQVMAIVTPRVEPMIQVLPDLFMLEHGKLGRRSRLK